jgi:DNA-binding NtrC family response regulator
MRILQTSLAMDTLLKIMPKYNVFIVDNDYYNGLEVRGMLQENLGEEVLVRVFPNAEACIAAMRAKEKPSVVILEYTENKRQNEENGQHLVDQIKALSPDAAIIIFADKNNSGRAAKALAYGAHDFVLKDQFMREHMLTAVKKSLHPAKM